jgi:predicted negative regulator of RcsB-dependent stress response
MTGSLIALLLLGLVIAGCWVGWLVWAKRKRDKAEASPNRPSAVRPLPGSRRIGWAQP